MTAVGTRRRERAAAGRAVLWVRRVASGASTGDAVGVLSVGAFVVFAVPTRLVVSPLGAAGGPAALYGLFLLAWWVLARTVPSLGVARVHQPVHTALCVLLGSIGLSYAWAALHPLTEEQTLGADRGVLAMLALTGFALVAADMIKSLEALERFLHRIVMMTTAVAGLAVIEFATGFEFSKVIVIPGLKANTPFTSADRSEFRRVAVTATHPIELGMVLAIVFFIALHFAFHAKANRRRWQVCAALIAIAIPMTVSRSAILALIVGGIVLFVTWSGPRRVKALIITSVFTVIMRLAIPGLVGTLSSLFVNISGDDSVKGRTDDYAIVGNYLASSPWLGSGFGTFIPKDFFFLDNQYLGSLIETGWIGFFALILFFGIGWSIARRTRRMAPTPEVKALAATLSACIIATALGFGTFDGLGFPMIDGLYFIILGCTGALWRITREQTFQRAPSSVRQPRLLVP
jgi:polysaccharide biosynthesis protein PslJ